MTLTVVAVKAKKNYDFIITNGNTDKIAAAMAMQAQDAVIDTVDAAKQLVSRGLVTLLHRRRTTVQAHGPVTPIPGTITPPPVIGDSSTS